MDVTYEPGPRVDPANRSSWQTTYERAVAGGTTRELAADHANEEWDSGKEWPPENARVARIIGSPVARVSEALGCETAAVPKDAIDALRSWEAAAGRAASTDETRAVLGKAGFDPLFGRTPAQRTVPGAGLPPEVPPTPMTTEGQPQKRRGRPPGGKNKSPGAPSARVSPNGASEEFYAKEHKAYSRAAAAIADLLEPFPPWRRSLVIELAKGTLAGRDASRRLLNKLSGRDEEFPHAVGATRAVLTESECKNALLYVEEAAGYVRGALDAAARREHE